MRFSIIVPVYNVSDYIESCVNSVISQDFNDYELVLVDDGSTDESGIICDNLRNKHNSIVVIHQKNGGLSNARNRGLAFASGDYIIFLDGDDCLVENSLSKINDEILSRSCDVYVGYAYSLDENGKKEKKGYLDGFPTKKLSGNEYLHLLKKYRKDVSFCSTFMIYNSVFLKNNKLTFEEGVLHEDELWTPQVLIKAEAIVWINMPFYYHRIREGSIMHSVNYDKKADSILIICKKLLQIFSENQNIDLSYLSDRMVMIYLSMVPLVSNPQRYKSEVDKLFAIKNSNFFDTYVKAFLFTISVDLYLNIYSLVKK